jgi:hypothetical protein
MLSIRDSLRKALPLLCLVAVPLAIAQAHAPNKPIEITQWRSGLTEINEGWATHAGDDLRWVQPNFDDSGWEQVDVEDIGPAQAGWRWFRKRVNLARDHSGVHLLLEGGDGTYELYVNGVPVEGVTLHSAFNVRRPIERVFPLPDDTQTLVLALRTRTPVNYAYYHLPPFMSVTLGGPTAIEYERKALESQRFYGVAPTVALNLMLCLAGITAFGLFAYQRSHREYLILGLYLFLTALSDGLVTCQDQGVVPTSVDILFADPLTYLFSIAQIEFTFAFAGRPVSRGWRVYEAFLLCPLVLVALSWNGYLPLAAYILVEALVTLPVAIILPIWLFAWWRKGNREAGLLIFPSMMPAATGIVSDLGTAAIFLHWRRLQFLADYIPVGPFLLAAYDLGAFLFFLAIGIVMFFRFTKVSREQARSAAELNAAREIQQRLVPTALPDVPGYTIEAAYLPAQEVGGDFYQVLAQPDGDTLVVVGDVSGKGLKAAMTGALAIGALRTLSSEGLSPAALLTRLNQQLLQTQDAGFVTCLCARINLSGQIFVANAGHLAPYRNGVEVPIESGLPLGIAAEAAYVESFQQLHPEDNLTLISDGVLEARNASGELLGFDRTRELSTQSAAGIARAAQEFGQEDDITVLTLKFESSVRKP